MKLLNILGLAVCLLAAPAYATIVRSMSLQDVARDADVAVHGEVLSRTARWNDGHTRIYTLTKVRVVESLKGPHATGATITVRQLGGTVDGLSQSVMGNARMAEGEEVMLFLRHDADKKLHFVVGMAQGKFAVDRSTAIPHVRRNLQGLALAPVKGGRLAHIDAPAVTGAAPTLAAFKGSVRSALTPR